MRVGVIGTGDITQIMHLPHLAELPEVTIHALGDPGTGVVETLGDRYGVPPANRFEGGEALLAAADDLALEAVVIATPMHTHADLARQALRADLHTFVEKPVAVTPEDARAVAAAADDSEGHCMVGYMKRYDPGFRRFATAVAEHGPVDFISARVIPPDVGTVIDETYDIVRADLDPAFLEASAERRRDQLETAVGTDDDRLRQAYGYHLESICHDVNALRALFGTVDRIEHVDLFNDWRYLTAQLAYGGGDGAEGDGERRCQLVSGATERRWYDERLAVETPTTTLSIAFSHAFMRNSPSTVRVTSAPGATATEHVPSYEEAFKLELERFVTAVVDDRPPTEAPWTTAAEAARDVALITDLFRRLRGAAPVGQPRGTTDG